MAAYYPLFEEELKEGPPGMPGIGFKLTNDGDYDMERKRLKNLNDPVDATDSCTRGYVDNLRSAVVNLSQVSLVYRQGAYDAKGKVIGNVSDPKADMNVVNKRYLENNALTLSDKGFLAQNNIIGDVKDPELSQDVVTKNYLENNTLILKDSHYDLNSARFKNMNTPIDRYDGVNKVYVDRLTKINDRKPNNILLRDIEGLFVPSLERNGVYDFENKRLTFVARPIDSDNAANKGYVDELRDKSLMHDGNNFDAKNKFISNVKWPEKGQDVVTKECLVYSCILWDKDKRIYFAHNQRIANVKAPQNETDCANKYYVDRKTFCATTSRGVEFTGVGYKSFQFNEFSSKLLDSHLKLSQNMYMKITVYLACDKMDENPSIRLEKGKEVLIDRSISVNDDSITMFAYGKLNDVLVLSVLSGGQCKLKPYLHIEKIEFNYK